VSEAMGRIPNRTLIHDTFYGHKFEEVINEIGYEDRISFSEIIPSNGEYYTNERILLKINFDIWCSYAKLDDISEDFTISNVCIYFKSTKDIDSILEKIKKCSSNLEDNIHLSKVNVLSISNGLLEIDPIEIDSELEMDLHPPIISTGVKKILKSIKSKKKSISVLRGPRGVGKTHISKWISLEVDMISIFIPINMVDHSINNPEFRNFLKKFENCILILDDCEFNYGYGKSPYLSGNIIQLIDILQNQNIHIIMIFNTNGDYEIDEDIMECIHLENDLHIGHLDPKFASKISKRLGISKKYERPVSISDILNRKSFKKIKQVGIQ